jgi:hypothetical protein
MTRRTPPRHCSCAPHKAGPRPSVLPTTRFSSCTPSRSRRPCLDSATLRRAARGGLATPAGPEPPLGAHRPPESRSHHSFISSVREHGGVDLASTTDIGVVTRYNEEQRSRCRRTPHSRRWAGAFPRCTGYSTQPRARFSVSRRCLRTVHALAHGAQMDRHVRRVRDQIAL